MAEFKVLELSPLRRTIPPPSHPLLNQDRPGISTETVAAPRATDPACWTSTALQRQQRPPPLRPSLPYPLRLLLVRHRRYLLQDQQPTSTLSIALVVVTIVVVIRTFLLAYLAPAVAAAATAVAMGSSSASVRRLPSWTSNLRRRRTLPSTSSTIAY